MIRYYDRRKAREVAIALSQNLISFHEGRRASARTPITKGHETAILPKA
jgi:hypothetical protein